MGRKRVCVGERVSVMGEKKSERGGGASERMEVGVMGREKE